MDESKPPESANIPPAPAGRVPTLQTFIKFINRYGIADPRTQKIANRLSYFQIAALRGHPDFQAFLDGVVLKALFSGRDIESGERWALNFLRETSRRPALHAGFDAAADEGVANFTAGGAEQTRRVINIKPSPEASA